LAGIGEFAPEVTTKDPKEFNALVEPLVLKPVIEELNAEFPGFWVALAEPPGIIREFVAFEAINETGEADVAIS
jgi:hypothetical protein